MLNEPKFHNADPTGFKYRPVCDLSRPAVPAMFRRLIILVICIEMGHYFGKQMRIFEPIDLTLYLSLFNYILFVGVCVFAPGRLRHLVRDKYFILLVLFLINCAFVDFISATLLYDQPLSGILRTTFRYGGLLVYPILFMAIDERLFCRLVKTLILLGCIGAVVTMVLRYRPDLAETLLVDKWKAERFDRIRLPILFEFPVYILFFISFIKTVKYKSAAWGAVWAITVYAVFYINMTRQIMLSFLGAMLFFIVFHLRFRQRMQTLALILIFPAGLSIFYPRIFDVFTDTVDSIIDPSTAAYDNFAIRKEAAAFYWAQFQQTDYIGFGRISLVHGERNPIRDELDREAGGRYFIADIGLFGSFFQYGFGLLLIIITAYGLAFLDIRRVIDRFNPREYALLVAIELLLIAEILRFGPFFSFESSAFYGSVYLFIIAYLCRSAAGARPAITADATGDRDIAR